jgi:hypothetical protein
MWGGGGVGSCSKNKSNRITFHFAARNATSLNTIENIHFIVIYDELESNLAQMNVIRCKFIIMQMNTRAQRMFMSLQRQTFYLSLFIFHYIVWIRWVQILGFSSR